MRLSDSYHQGMLDKLAERYEAGAFSDKGYKIMQEAVFDSALRQALLESLIFTPKKKR